ncbi:SIR2 family protein [Gimesia aquarii]|uniref:Uncharacterized protein n=1 Tax=Gimesia aquarii TaxID=2527964 RepID=A0A517VZL2_9PLAN|nr:SIR2 family protein [Gimesia aquarii]QDT98444.1 hypothetical protein V144x_39460 [Gimesia aquarii]
MTKASNDSKPIHLESTEFISKIRDELIKGNGFVPLLGAGVSVGSGVPVISEVRAYLAKCLKLALGVGLPEQDLRKRRWYPRTDAWPPLRNIRLQDAHHAFDELAAEIHKKRESIFSTENESEVFEEAIGALADWRSLLLFLSRLELFPESSSSATDDDKTNILRLGPPNYDVVDSLFRHISSGKRPCLVHSMIAQLASPMRYEVVLTTNLDELTEEAFREAGEPLDPVEVHLSAGIPTAVSKHDRILIKLHGGRYGVRADYSLDDAPTLKEKENFRSYFWRNTHTSYVDYRPESQNVFGNKIATINHAFVLGTSGNDRRVIELLKHTVKQNNGSEDVSKNKRPRIFWVCHTERDRSEVHNSFQDSDAEVYTVTHTFLGAFLLQLYQSVTCSLPPKSAPFPSSASFSFPPADLTPHEIRSLDNLINAGIDQSGKNISKHADSLFHDEKRVHTEKVKECRLLRISATPEKHGVVSKGIHHFYRAMIKQRQCVWMSMEHIGSTDELFEILTDAVAKTAGLSDWMPIVLYDQSEKAVREIRRLTQGRKEWVIFIDARDGAGSSKCDMDTTKSWKSSSDQNPNGWLDQLRENNSQEENSLNSSEDRSSNTKDFADLLARVSGPECQNVNIVLLYHAYLPNTDSKIDKNQSPLHQYLDNKNLGHFIKVEDSFAFQTTNFAGTLRKNTSTYIIKPTSFQHTFSQKEAARKAFTWADTTEKATFLLALCLADRFRYPNLLLSDAFFPPEIKFSSQNITNGLRDRYDNVFGKFDSSQKMKDQKTKDNKINGWINELADAKHCAIRRMPGNFTWMHAPTRNYLRKEFQNNRLENNLSGIWEVRNSKDSTQQHTFACYRAQYLIAHWYDKLFRSSGDPLAGLEGVSHYLKAAYESLQILLENEQKNIRKKSIVDRKYRIDWESPEILDVPIVPCEQLITTLTSARLLLQEVEPAASVSGYPKATCRRLVYIRHELLSELYKMIPQKKKMYDTYSTNDRKALLNAKSLIQQLVLRTLYINRGIAREVSEHNRAFFRHRQIREYLLTHKFEINRRMPENRIDFVELKEEEQNNPSAKFFEQSIWKKWIKKSPIDIGDLHLLNELASWHRHGGILFLATRGYPAAINQLSRAFRISCSVIQDDENRELPQSESNRSTKIVRWYQSGKVLEEDELVQVKEMANSLLFRPKDHHENFVNPYRGDFNNKNANNVRKLMKVIGKGISPQKIEVQIQKPLSEWQLVAVSDLAKCMCRQVQWLIVLIESGRFACGQSIAEKETEWCQKALEIYHRFGRIVLRLNPTDTLESVHSRQMMETQMSTIFGIQEDWHKAHECLDKARGLLSSHKTSDSLLNTGIIELHRAQLYLLHARSIGNGIVPETRRHLLRMLHRISQGNRSKGLDGLKKSEQEIIEYLKDAKKHWIAKQKSTYKSKKSIENNFKSLSKDLSSGRRLLEDAEASLKKAESALVQKRKNVWWSTWLFELQAKVIEYRLLFSIHERVCNIAWEKPEIIKEQITSTRAGHVPISDFGSNSCPRGEPTVLDEALENTLRMVRLDLIRLSRVIESYAFCHWALSVLIQLSPDLEWLPTRQEMMRKALGADRQRSAIEILQSKIGRRLNMPPALDPFAHAYAENTLQLARDVTDFTPIRGGS